MKTVIFLLSLVHFVFAQADIEYTDLRFPAPSPETIVWALVLFGVVVLVILVGMVFQDYQKKKITTDAMDKQFMTKCSRFGLNGQEISQLRHLLQRYSITPQTAVFTSLQIFEELVEKECELIIQRGGTSDKSENETHFLTKLRTKLGYDKIPAELPIFSSRNINEGEFFDVLPEQDSTIAISSACADERTELVMKIRFNLQKAGFNPQAVKQVVIQYTRPGDAVYTIPMKVLDVNMATQTLLVLQTVNVSRLQFRDFVRISVEIPLQCRLISRVKAAKNQPLGTLAENCTILDISGGGMAFISDTELHKEDLVSLSFSLDSRKFILKGEVIGVHKKEIRGSFRFKHRIAFKEIQAGDSDAIVFFIFERQREQIHLQG